MPPQPRMHRYEQIAGEIRTAIARGAYRPEGRLPSERRLVRAFQAQRNTVRQALALLEREGRIASVDKSGWFVAEGGGRSAEERTSGRRVLFVTFRRGTLSSSDTIAHALGDALGFHGLQLLRFDSAGHKESTHVATIDELMAFDAGGIVMWPHGPIEASLLARLQASTPVVLIDRRVFGFESDSVRFDDEGGGRLATEHLLANGHRRIAFLGDEPFVESVQSRWTGYRKALEQADVEPDENLTLILYGQHEPTFSASLRFMLRGLPDPPTAVVCSNDGVASRLMMFLREEGLRVPDDVAVTGFGNATPDYLDVMGLTTVAQSLAEMGRVAGELLADRLAHPPVPHDRTPHEILLPMSLVPRASSGPHR